MDGSLRLEGGGSGPGYEYGRLEVFLRGFWSNVCNVDGFTPDSAQVACAALGFGGGASLQFFQPYAVESSVRTSSLSNTRKCTVYMYTLKCLTQYHSL